MKNSTYKSVPVIASIIGSKSRKAMYLTNITSLDGKRIYKDKWIPTSWSSKSKRQTIEWEYDSQSLVEFPISRVSQAMIIESYDNSNVSRIKSRLVDGKVVEYYQIKDRYVIYVPTWLIKNFEERYTTRIVDEELFDNDDMYYGVAEETAMQSVINEQFDYINRDTMNFENIDSLTQWELDNPEYASYS